jgi:ABC-type glutathione transport system ATPase component
LAILPLPTNLLEPALVFRGSDAALPVAQRPAHMRQAMQMVFQQTETTLNPRHTVGQVLGCTCCCRAGSLSD